MKKHLLLNIVLSAVFLLVSIVSRVFNTNPVFVIVCGIIASIVLIGILVLFAIAFMNRLYCLAIFVVAYWGLCIDSLFYDGFGGKLTMASRAIISLIPAIIFTLLIASLRILKMRKAKQQIKFSDAIITFLITTVLLFFTFFYAFNYLDYALAGGKHMEVSVEIEEFVNWLNGSFLGPTDNVYSVHSLENNVYIDTVKISNKYDVASGDIVTVTYYDGLFGKTYKVCNNTLPYK